MSLESGSRIGPYEVIALIGEGGMGEVYRARDGKLNRDVAIKLLGAFGGDRDRLARFEREAQVLASLHHPNIASIFGLEDSQGEPAIVMELVDGREASGPLPVPEALHVARQIAEALEFAHERGVIHRDLKPANIKITADGTVKVLDFGLAKALSVDEPAHASRLANSPTMSLGATQAGVVLGTAAYMSPEQAKGKVVDRRADVWAFGVLLFELLTGRQLFDGETIAETLANVIKEPITFDALPAGTPTSVRSLLKRCLDRDVRRRLQSMGEARIAIEDAIAGTSGDNTQAVASDQRSSGWRRGLPWAVAAAAVLAAAASLAWGVSRSEPALSGVIRFTIAPPDGVTQTGFRTNSPHMAVSPDGRYVAMVLEEPGRGRAIWIRPLDSLVAERLDRTEGATNPFWSPDSQHIAYFANRKLMRTALVGGATLAICDAPDGEGGTWHQADGEDGVIVFAPGQNGPLHRVAANGGSSRPVTTLGEGEVGHAFPQFLSDGRRILYTARSAGLVKSYVQILGASERQLLLEGQGIPAFGPPNVLVYPRDRVLLAHRFNPDTVALEGEPVPIADGVRAGTVRSPFSVSAGGILVYRGGVVDSNVQIRWYGRDGKPGDVVIPPGDMGHLEISPDARWLVISRATTSDRDLWVKDLSGGALSRLTSSPDIESQPAWAPDSRRVAFSTGAGVAYTLIGSGSVAPVPGAAGLPFLEDWTPDGRHLVARQSGRTRLVPAPAANGGSPTPSGSSEPQEILSVTYEIDHLQVAPDGKWVAYSSQESGRPEIVIARFPSFTDRRQISIDGAAQPRWRADGKELFFHAIDQRMMAVEITLGDVLRVGPVRELFRTNPMVLSNQIFMYDVTPDGQRFLMREPVLTTGGNSVEPLYVVTNWTSLLNRR